MHFHRQLLALLLPLAVFAQTPPPAPDLPSNPAATINPLDPALPTIFIAGDSTAAKNNGDPIQGWGLPFADYFDATKVNIANRARGGRSSRTFITEGLWDKMLGEMKRGDFVLIQFGHNDASAINRPPPGSTRPIRARGTLKGIGEESEEIDNAVTNLHETVHTFGWYIRKMIAEVKAKGATPIILSLTARNHWQDGKIERGLDRYRDWDRELARAAGVEFLDLTRIAADKFQALGEEKTNPMFSPDRTHLTTAGADFQAACVVSGLKGIRKGAFNSFLSPKGEDVPADTIGFLNLPEPANPAVPSIILIGDSTVRNGIGDGSNGKWGWGDSLGKFFDPAKVNVVNRAIGGLSSRTFLTQGHWERVLGLLKPGDFVVMQFGHNDGGPLNAPPPGSSFPLRARGTIKGVGEETEAIDNVMTKRHEIVHSYGWYLRKYIREAKAAGATPIVCSPIPRNSWQDGKVARVDDSYGGWARAVAQQEGAAFIDLNNLAAARYEELGKAAVEAMFVDEVTHTSKAGADLNAAIVTAALRTLPGAPVNAFLSEQGRTVSAARP